MWSMSARVYTSTWKALEAHSHVYSSNANACVILDVII